MGQSPVTTGPKQKRGKMLIVTFPSQLPKPTSEFSWKTSSGLHLSLNIPASPVINVPLKQKSEECTSCLRLEWSCLTLICQASAFQTAHTGAYTVKY